jgi:hypothetical protein
MTIPVTISFHLLNKELLTCGMAGQREKTPMSSKDEIGNFQAHSDQW